MREDGSEDLQHAYQEQLRNRMHRMMQVVWMCMCVCLFVVLSVDIMNCFATHLPRR